VKLVTAAQMRDLEARAVEAGTSLDELMEAAGLAVAQEAWLSLGVVAGRRILVLAGPGNNGGDGLVAARHLAEWEADVVAYLLAPRDDEKLRAATERGVRVILATEDGGYELLDEALAGAELVIDALLGIGASRPIEGPLAEITRRLQAQRERAHPPAVVAVDVPTGVDSDSGRADPLAVHADLTVTFGLAKVGLYMLPGSEHAGRVQVIDIGIPKDAEARVAVELIDASWVRVRLPERPKGANKGTFGRVLVVAGSADYPGAARLASEASYRAGAGLVTLACVDAVRACVAPAAPEVTYVPLGDALALAPAMAAPIVDALAGADVPLLGPGLSRRDGVREAVAALIDGMSDAIRACVIDADGLNHLASIDGWPARLRAPCVLTPHPGEMARLTGASVSDIQDDRLRRALDAARAWGQVVVLKGAHTIVAAPDGRAAISPHANPLLATAGTGDVLAGVIAGLIAQGMEPFEAAAGGVYIHGAAAEEAGESLGDRGMVASDLLPAVPRAIRTVREGKVARQAPPLFGGMQGLGALSGLMEPSG